MGTRSAENICRVAIVRGRLTWSGSRSWQRDPASDLYEGNNKMARQSGERRDVFGLIVGIVVAIALGISLYSGTMHSGQEAHFFGSSASQGDRPVLPTVTRPTGQ